MPSRGPDDAELSGSISSFFMPPPSKVARYLVVVPGRSCEINQPFSLSHFIADLVLSLPILATLAILCTEAQQPWSLPFPCRQIEHQTIIMW